jgi:hypothetical protein
LLGTIRDCGPTFPTANFTKSEVRAGIAKAVLVSEFHVHMEMWCKYKIRTGFQRLRTKISTKYLINNFTDYMVK